ncbi:hypothetical protein AMTR_s00095p00137540 [Amborella trichopoda]|uniref:Ribosomal protein S6 n=1 Tax=Amborella trichopoda TaxID=13333 RepID=W1NT80_AMBTC|nr:hypothetical protein AMTR_s00095p00137540 [Amborella trichopoda]
MSLDLSTFGLPQGQLMQMTMMVTPNFNKELHYLNKEDRLLRWLLVKHRDTKYGLEFVTDSSKDYHQFRRSGMYEDDDDDDEDDDDDSDYELDDESQA